MSLLTVDPNDCGCPGLPGLWNPQDPLREKDQQGFSASYLRPLVRLNGVPVEAPEGVYIPWQTVAAPKITYDPATGYFGIGWGGINLGAAIDQRMSQNSMAPVDQVTDVTDAGKSPCPSAPFLWRRDEAGEWMLCAYNPERGWFKVDVTPLGSAF